MNQTIEKELSPRQKKSLETRKRIFDATYQLVNQYGDAYTVQDVCRLASVSVGSFYHFYKSKEEVTSDLYLFLTRIWKKNLRYCRKNRLRV